METLIREDNISDMMKMDSIALLILLYLDDGAIPLASRKDATIGTKICIDAMIKFELIVRTGVEKKESKAKADLFPSTLTIKRWRSSSPILITISTPHQKSNNLINLRDEN